MNTKILLLIFVFLLSFKPISNAQCRVDTINTYQSHDNLDDYYIKSRIIKTYDVKNRLTSVIEQQYLGDKNWRDLEQKTFKYNDLNLINSYTLDEEHKIFNFSINKFETRTLNKYKYIKNNLIELEQWYFNPSNCTNCGSNSHQKTINKFNNKNLLSQTDIFYWDTLNNINSGRRNIYNYDNENNLTEEFEYGSYDPKKLEFSTSNASRYTYSYNQSKKMTQKIHYHFDDYTTKNWVAYYKTISQFNNKNQITSLISSILWGNKWEIFIEEKFQYNNFDSLIKHTGTSYDLQNKIKFNTYFHEFTYDNNKNLMKKFSYYYGKYDTTLNKFIGNSSYTDSLIYNTNNKLIEKYIFNVFPDRNYLYQARYKYDYNGDELKYDYVYHWDDNVNRYMWSNKNEYICAKFKSEIVLKVYPNPATDNINIELRKGKKFEIFNATGELIYSNIANSEKFELYIKDYSFGVYFIKSENEFIKFVKY